MLFINGIYNFLYNPPFRFALTSFTPQGGGEAPKSLSGRVLVAAYWLFVVLMLATFTANLAAFLTVERMQTTVQGEVFFRVVISYKPSVKAINHCFLQVLRSWPSNPRSTTP